MKNIDLIRKDFPILDAKVNGHNLIYLDNAATSQTPNCVIDSISDYYKNLNSNIHRGVHFLSQKATEKYENTRKKFKVHLNANSTKEIIFTSGTTHSINLVANGFVNSLKKGDEIIVSQLEHHSNIVPWQMLCEKTGAVMKVIPMNNLGELDLNAYEKLLSIKNYEPDLLKKVDISYALGKSYEDLKNYEKAFNYLSKANQLKFDK